MICPKIYFKELSSSMRICLRFLVSAKVIRGKMACSPNILHRPLTLYLFTKGVSLQQTKTCKLYGLSNTSKIISLQVYTISLFCWIEWSRKERQYGTLIYHHQSLQAVKRNKSSLSAVYVVLHQHRRPGTIWIPAVASQALQYICKSVCKTEFVTLKILVRFENIVVML